MSENIEEFNPNWTLSPQDQLAVRLAIALPKHIPGWPGCTDEQLDAVAADLSPLRRRTIGIVVTDKALAAKDATIEDLSRKLEEARHRIAELESKLDFRANVTDAAGEFTEGLIARNEAFEFALTPSEETKFTYMGEVNFWHTDFDENGNEHRIRLDVPWISIRELMKLIRKKADLRAAHRAMIKAEKEQGE